MKVIIRDLETGGYVHGPSQWTDIQKEAMAFKNSIAALEFCVAHRIHDIEILLLDLQVGAPLRLFPRQQLGIPPMVETSSPCFDKGLELSLSHSGA